MFTVVKTAFLLAALLLSATTVRAQDSAAELAAALDVDAPPPTVRFQQALSSPRIGGRLTAVIVDRAGSIFVGTEEGTIVRSTDGGLTWDERIIDPFVASARGIVVGPPVPAPGGAAASTLRSFLDPPFSRYLDRIFVPGVNLPQYDTLPDGVSAFFVDAEPPGPTELLDAVTRTQLERTRPVRRIAICPGIEHELLVATRFNLYGSNDGGETYVRLYGVPGGVEMADVRCEASNPRHVLLSTGAGLYRSTDGALTFDYVIGTAALRLGASASAFGADGKIFAAYGPLLYGGDPTNPAGLDYVFPDWDDASTAPWEEIFWIERTPTGALWIATADGLRRSPDDGATWDAPARMQFDRQRINQVVRGTTENGAERIAVLGNDFVFVSDDNGRSFYPLFQGQTRRTLAMLAAGRGDGELWLVAGGELWTTARLPHRIANDRENDDRRWARARLRTTPSLDRVMRAILEKLELDAASLADLFSRSQDRAYAPRVDASFRLLDESSTLNGAAMGTNPNTLSNNVDRTNWEVFVQATFALRDAAYSEARVSSARNQLHELQRQVGFVTEDAWHERRLLLMRIARGETSEMQAEIYRERIAALEAILELWMDAPLDAANVRRD